MNDLISVLIPTYNAQCYIARCLDSVLLQTYKPIEMIIVNDGSTDQTTEIVNNYQKQNDNIRMIYIKNQGLSFCRQLLCALAKGKYYFFLDSDDYIHPNCLSTMVNELIKEKADVVQCKMQHTSEIGYLLTDSQVGEVQIYTRNQALHSLQCGYDKIRCMLAGKLFRAGVLENIVFPYGKKYEDEATIHRILYQTQLVLYIDQPLYIYYRNPDSLTHQVFSEKDFDILSAIQDRIEFDRAIGRAFDADMNMVRLCWHCVSLLQRLDTTEQMVKRKEETFFLLRETLNQIIHSSVLPVRIKQDVLLWVRYYKSISLPSYWKYAARWYKEYEKHYLSI